MGEMTVHAPRTETDRRHFLQIVLRDIEALDLMIREDRFEQKKQRIGAEQELCIIDESGHPSMLGPEILEQIDDPRFTTEIGRFNLEVNLDPFELRPDCLRLTERQLLQMLGKVNQAASEFDSRILLTGTLPSINHEHLHPENMTPRARYKLLSDNMRALRGDSFNIRIHGVDELIAELDSVLFEACNTSFQLHLQIPPQEFVSHHNWSQMIAGPMLAACVNSPLLFGRELWQETRIALFQQSVDTRSTRLHLRDRRSRVAFGDHWLQHSPVEIFRDQVARFPILLTRDVEENSQEMVRNRQTPKLRGLQLHNGTVYSWNRCCYGISSGYPHLRIENRYLPSGPTVADEMANFAFWIGLMKGFPEEYHNFEERFSFRNAKDNFYRAARSGLHSLIDWFDGPRPAAHLVADELLPIAERGLRKVGINEDDLRRYLGIIEGRVRSMQTGAQWQVRNFRKLVESFGTGVALPTLTRGRFERQRSSEPVHRWPDIDTRRVYAQNKQETTVGQYMSTDLFCVNQEEPLSFVKSIMGWKKIRHLPVENKQGDLTGLVTATNLRSFSNGAPDWKEMPIKNLMVNQLITVSSDTPLKSAAQLMRTHGVGCLPIVSGNKLIGLITDTDMRHLSML